MKIKELWPQKYYVWVNHGYEGWSPHGYNTVEEAIAHEGYGSEKVITKIVDYEIKEVD